jgi:hypothetical protein
MLEIYLCAEMNKELIQKIILSDFVCGFEFQECVS